MRVITWRRSLLFALFVAAIAAIVVTHTLRAGTAAVSGELVETFCWTTVAAGGTAHASCGIECAKRGIPVAVYDARSRTTYVLLPKTDKGKLPSALIEQMGRQVTVRGDVLRRGGASFMRVDDWAAAR